MTYPIPLTEHASDFSTELDAAQFAREHGFYLAATAQIKHKDRFIKNPEVNPIQYVPAAGREEQYKEYAERIYILAIDGRVAKIGGTYTGMAKRHQSYNCGTRKARAAGTCSTTNYHITHLIIHHHSQSQHSPPLNFHLHILITRPYFPYHSPQC